MHDQFMMQQWRETGQLLKGHGRTLVALVLLLVGPLLCLDALAVLVLGLAPDDADKGIGLLNVLLMPVLNGCIVWILHRGYQGERPSLWAALQAATTYWSRLFVAYVGVSLITLAWLVATVLPAYIGMAMFKIQQPYLLIPFGLVGLVLALPRFAFIDPVVVIEGLSPFYARQRSAALVKSRRWTVLGCGAVAYALPLCLELAGEGLPDLLGLDARSTGLALSLSVGLASALLYVVPIVFFYTYYRALAVTPAAIEPKEQL